MNKANTIYFLSISSEIFFFCCIPSLSDQNEQFLLAIAAVNNLEFRVQKQHHIIKDVKKILEKVDCKLS